MWGNLDNVRLALPLRRLGEQVPQTQVRRGNGTDRATLPECIEMCTVTQWPSVHLTHVRFAQHVWVSIMHAENYATRAIDPRTDPEYGLITYMSHNVAN